MAGCWESLIAAHNSNDPWLMIFCLSCMAAGVFLHQTASDQRRDVSHVEGHKRLTIQRHVSHHMNLTSPLRHAGPMLRICQMVLR